MRKSKSLLHPAAIAAGVAVGNLLIRYPWRSGAEAILPRFLLFALCALLPALFFYPLFKKLYRGAISRHGGKRMIAIPVSCALFVYALYGAWQAFSDYIGYAADLVLTARHEWLLAAAFLVLAAILAQTRKKGLDVFALLSVFAAVLCVLILFLFGIPNFRAEFLSLRVTSLRPVAADSLSSLLEESFLPLLLLSAYFALTLGRHGGKALVLGAGVGYGLLLVCVLQTLFTFGADYAGSLPYPYAYAVRVISIGPYFFRLEGFSYWLDYTACLLRVSVFLAVAKRLFCRFLPRVGRYFPSFAALLLFIIFILR